MDFEPSCNKYVISRMSSPVAYAAILSVHERSARAVRKLNNLNGLGWAASGCKQNYTRNLHVKQVITRK